MTNGKTLETCNDLIIKFEKMTVTEEEEFFFALSIK